MADLRLAGKWLVVVAPMVASTVMLSPAADAAMFALSEASAEFSQFSLIPWSQEVFTNTNTQTIATSGEVSADSEADAAFFAIPPKASNFSFSQVAGNGTEYQGFAARQAQVLENFFIPQDAKDKAFSFDFALNLETGAAV